MKVTLPPDTQLIRQKGTLITSVTTIYLNCSVPSVQYYCKLWGVQEDISFNNATQCGLSPKLKTQHYTQSFAVSTNLSKLATYLTDMGVLIIKVKDGRTHQEIGTGFVKLKRYVVNGLISDFEEVVEIFSARQTNARKAKIGEILFKLTIKVPSQVGAPFSSENPVQQLKQAWMGHSDSWRKQNMPFGGVEAQPVNTRKIVVEPHVFEQKNDANHLKQYVIDEAAQGKRSFEFKQEDRSIGEVIEEIPRPRKLATNLNSMQNVLQFLSEDSLNQYPSIEELRKKYGSNNVCAERMRLKIDEATYLGKRKHEELKNEDKGRAPNGFIVKFKNYRQLAAGPEGFPLGIQVTHLQSGNDQKVLNRVSLADIKERGFYATQLNIGEAIQFENKLLKGKLVLKRESLSGDVSKVYLKRKDNGRKIAEFDVVILNLFEGRAFCEEATQHLNKHGSQQAQGGGKYHFFVGVKPVLKGQECFMYTLQPECQKDAVEGGKMIFTAQNTLQSIKIQVRDQTGAFWGDICVRADPSIKMKEETVAIGSQQFRVFVGSAEDIENLLKLVMLSDFGSSQADSSRQRINKTVVNDERKSEGQKARIESDRQQMLKVVFQCFQSLVSTTNSECMEIVEKFSSLSLSYDEQLALFQRLCESCEVPAPQLASLAFKQLLHGQFSMFWSCFEQYKDWNECYLHSLAQLSTQIQSLLKECLTQEATSQYMRDCGQVNRAVAKMLESAPQRLHLHQQTLFGLIPAQTCESLLLDYFRNCLTRYSNKFDLNCSISSQLGLKLKDLVVLLCRFSSVLNKNAPAHCLKIQEISTFLKGSCRNSRIFLNCHQVVAISASLAEQREQALIFQLAKSCLADTDGRGYCSQSLAPTITQYGMKRLQANSRTEYEQNNRLQTENGNILKARTEENERFYTQEAASQAKRKTDPQPFDKEEAEIQSIKIFLTQLMIKDGQNKSMSIEVREYKSKACLLRIRGDQLPRQVELKLMQEYQVAVSSQSQLIGSQHGERAVAQKYQGLFIANETSHKILLYHKQNQRFSEIGWILTTASQAREDQEQMAVQIVNRAQFPISESPSNSQQGVVEQQEERKRLTKVAAQKVLQCPTISYKILSISPPPRSDREYTVWITGIEKPIQYQGDHLVGKVVNLAPSDDSICISIQDGNRGPQLKQKMPKIASTQEVCFTRDDGTVGYICTIQLDEYTGDDVPQILCPLVQRVILLNIYHMQSVAKMDSHHNFTIVVTTQSSQEPVFLKDFTLAEQCSRDVIRLRSAWIGASVRVGVSSKYDICIYGRAKGTKYSEQNLIGHFEFKIRFHPKQIGIYSHKGYLVDERGFRLAMTAFEINYNDIFSTSEVGRQKFESLLSVFSVQNIVKLNKACKLPSDVEPALRSHFGLNNTQIHLISQLEKSEGQLLHMFANLDVDQLLLRQDVNTSNYSIEDLYSEFQIYDFTNGGIIPRTKAELVAKLVFQQTQAKISIEGAFIKGKEGWAIDLRSQDESQIDYLLVLWCLRKHAADDGFFFCKKYDERNIKGTNQSTGLYLKPAVHNTLSQIGVVHISLLGYRGLQVNGVPATLTFYINGEKMAEPIPRCFAHQYEQPKVIRTHFPLTLQIYNKVYGTRELYRQELVGTLNIYQEQVQVLGGNIHFLIQQSGITKLVANQKQKQGEISRIKQSRRDRWLNMKKTQKETMDIANILSDLTS